MNEEQTITTEMAQRVRELLSGEDTPFARACLRMLSGEASINETAAAEGTNMFELMSQWHAFADKYGIVATDGSRACIHVLLNASQADEAANPGEETARPGQDVQLAEPHRTPVIIDTDPGCDDAVALMLALGSPEIDVRLITSVGGNVSLVQTTHNCLVVQHFLGTRVPVARGTTAPGFGPGSTAELVHGATGLGAWAYDEADGSLLLDEPALEAQARVLRESNEPVTIIAIGPLTNIATLLSEHEELYPKIARIVVMGGAIGRGNMGPYTEFNIGTDPESAARVFASGVPVVLVPLEVADAAVLTAAELEALGQINPVGAAIRDLQSGPEPSRPSMESKPMYDPTTVAYVCRPDLFTCAERRVAVELAGTYTRGATVVFTGEPLEGNYTKLEGASLPVLRVCSSIDNAGFKRWLSETIRRWDA